MGEGVFNGKPGSALAVARGLVKQLGEIHSQGFVHGRVMPENVFLGRRDGKTLVGLKDFGFMLREGENMGREFALPDGYFPPGITTAYPVDKRLDMYGVGCILFEMLTGYKWSKANEGYVKSVMEELPLEAGELFKSTLSWNAYRDGRSVNIVSLIKELKRVYRLRE